VFGKLTKKVIPDADSFDFISHYQCTYHWLIIGIFISFLGGKFGGDAYLYCQALLSWHINVI